ncbi:MAG: hypothetical protein ACLPKB_08015 [Xanthobacteraceae bacterium]
MPRKRTFENPSPISVPLREPAYPFAALLSSLQFGRASAPTKPHREHAMRGPIDGTSTVSGMWSTLNSTE